jgi:hypothetical protein
MDAADQLFGRVLQRYVYITGSCDTSSQTQNGTQTTSYVYETGT